MSSSAAGSPGAVREEDRVGAGVEQHLRVGAGRVELQARPALDEVADDRALDAGVERGDQRPSPVAVLGHLGGADLLHEVLAGHVRLGVDDRAGLRFADRGREDAAAHRALVTQVLDQCAGVELVDGHDAAVAQPVEPAALGGRGILAVGRGTHDHATRPDPSDSIASWLTPVVPDVR